MVQWSCTSIAPRFFMACTRTILPLSAFPHTAFTDWRFKWICGRTRGNEFCYVLFGRDSCRGVLKSKSFATDNSLRDSSELVNHPCRHFQLSYIYVILYLKVIYDMSLIFNQAVYTSDSVLYMFVIVMAGDTPKDKRDRTSYLSYTTHSLSLFCATRSIPVFKHGVVKPWGTRLKGRGFDPRWCHWNFSLP